MVKYYIFDDIFLGTDVIFPSLSVEIKHVEDCSTQEITVNPSHSVSVSRAMYIEHVIRPVRNKILDLTDMTELGSSRDSAGARMGASEKESVFAYRDALRDLPATIISNGYSDFSFPSPCTEYPQTCIDLINKTENEMLEDMVFKYFGHLKTQMV